jgi:hypothetical protein
MSDIWEAVQKHLVALDAQVDVGMCDEHIIDVTRNVTPAYAKWLEENDEIEMCDGGTTGPGRHYVEKLIYYNLRIVSALLEKGVPAEVVLPLLPHEILELLRKDNREKMFVQVGNKRIALLADLTENDEPTIVISKIIGDIGSSITEKQRNGTFTPPDSDPDPDSNK